jgi:MFS family permease
MSTSLNEESGSIHTEPKQDLEKVATSATTPESTVKIVHADGFVDYVDKKAIGGDSENMPKGYFRSPQFLGTVAAQCMGSIVAYLGWVLPANTLALINADLGNSKDINWVATVWTLGSCIGFLIVGRMSDIFGRKWMVQSSMALSLIGCIIGAVAKSVNMLIAANLCNGLAAAGQLSFGIVMGELVPNRLRGPVITMVFLSSLPFAVFGPVIARLFIDNTAAKWRWSYYLGIIFSGLTMILYQFFYHPPTYDQLHMHGKSKWQMFKELDFVGIFLFIAGCVLFLIGLSWGGQAYPWVSAEVLCTIIIGLLTLAAFVIYGKPCPSCTVTVSTVTNQRFQQRATSARRSPLCPLACSATSASTPLSSSPPSAPCSTTRSPSSGRKSSPRSTQPTASRSACSPPWLAAASCSARSSEASP